MPEFDPFQFFVVTTKNGVLQTTEGQFSDFMDKTLKIAELNCIKHTLIMQQNPI